MRSPTSQARAGRRRWLGWLLAGVAAAALLAAALWLCVAVLPQRLYPPLSSANLAGLSSAERAERREGRDRLQNDARTTLLQGLAALLVLGGASIGAAVTLRQVRTGREQLEQAREQAQRSDKRLREQIAVAQEGQITERFTRAVDQLGQPGPDRLDVRLGGIFALERIAHDSLTHRLAVVEILTAFVRSYAPWPPRLPGQYRADAPIDQMPSLQARASDIYAALTVISRRPTQKDDPRLNLNETDLRVSILDKANLAGVLLSEANLTGVWLQEANLEGASLHKANLTVARLERANLMSAHLGEAILIAAKLAEANLKLAGLAAANLRLALLEGANLEGARLSGANLEGAQFFKANLTRAQLDDANLTGASLFLADLTGAQLSGANLTRATLSGANLTGAQLEEADLRGAHLGDAILTGAQLSGVLANRQTVWPDGWDRARRAAAGVDEPSEKAPPAASSSG
jgi:uncharacterized protein YjbI with pentapeptide repeats